MAAQGDIRKFDAQRAAPPAAPLGGGSGLKPLGLGMKLPEIQVSSPAMDDAVSGIQGEQARLREYLPGMQAQVDSARDALGAELEKPLPARPVLKDIPQFQPRELSNQELSLFAGISMALAGLGTKAMRGNTAMALNAAGGAMKGFNEGNLQQSRLDIQNFKQQMDAVLAENAKNSEEYRQIIESRKMSLAQKEQALRVAAAGRDDQVMLSALQTGQLKMVFDLEAHRIKAGNEASVQASRMFEMAQWRIAQLEEKRRHDDMLNNRVGWQIFQRPDGSLVRVNAATGVTEPVAGGQMMRPGQGGKGEGGRPLPAKAADDMSGRQTIIGELNGLIAEQEKAIAQGQGYGGYGIDQVGNLVVKGGRALGQNTPEALFFSRLESVAQPDRHELFGATLTGGEKASWREGWVGTGDNPQTLLSVLKQKRDMYQRMLESKRTSYSSMGFQVGPGGAAPRSGAPGGAGPQPSGAPAAASKQYSTSKSGRSIFSLDGGRTWEYE